MILPIFTPFLRLWPLLAIASALLALAALSLNPGAALSQSAPAVTGVAVTSTPASGDIYAMGETIRVAQTFSEAVNVTGAPRLKIKMDPDYGEKWAAYESGSGTTSLSFVHEVVQPNLSTQGIAVLEDTLELNGGAIKSAASGDNAALSHTGLGHDANHKVDWQANRAATGAPAVTGTARVGGTLTADTSDISDGDGLINATFSYQWTADDADISGATGNTYTLAAADEGKAVKVRVSFTDDAGNDETLTSAATDPVGAPVTVAGASDPSYAEHGTDIVATYTTGDPGNDGIEWSISGADADEFSINSSGELSFNEPPDFENPADADTNNTYVLTVAATAGDQSDSLEVTVTVTDGNDPPSFLEDGFHGEFTFEENRSNDQWKWHSGFTLGAYTATDLQDNPIYWTIGGPDKDAFVYSSWVISGRPDLETHTSSSTLTILDTPVDYENPNDHNKDGVYEITIDISDRSLSTSLPVTVTVLDIDEAPVITGEAAVYYMEDSTEDVGAYSAADPEGGTATLTMGGADADSFSFSDGVLRFNSPPDYETKNSYSVTFTSTDEADESGDTRTSSLDVAVIVTEYVEGLAINRSADPIYAEHGTDIVKTYTARDPENRSIEWSISGTDADEFSINSSGELRFSEPPDFENPTDSDRNNKYALTVEATAGDQSDSNDSMEVTVTVTNRNDPPFFLGGNALKEIEAEENHVTDEEMTNFAFFEAADFQDDWVLWSLGGPDKDSFRFRYYGKTSSAGLDRSHTAIRHLHEPLDYENPRDADKDGVYEFTIDITDASNGPRIASLPVRVTVLDIDEAPVISGEAAVDYAEGSTADVGAYSATDPDGGVATLTLGGPDADGFSFSGGVLRFNSTPDHETKTCHSVRFTATDEADESGAIRSSSRDVAITIARENDGAPSHVTGLSVLSLPASGDTYALGETIRIRVTFSGAVDVTGTPRLKIDMDPAYWGEKWANYESGSGTANLTFAYQVVEPNLSTQGISVLENTLELNGGRICSAMSTNTLLEHTGLGHDPDHKVDWQANMTATGEPTITGTVQVGETLTADTSGVSDVNGLTNATFSYQWIADDADISGATGNTYTLAAADEGKAITVQVSFTDDAGHGETLTSAATAAVAAATPPDVTGVAATSTPSSGDTYGLGETIQVTVTFSEAVDVTGTPRLKIKMDPDHGEKWAIYETGTGTSSVSFTYEVVEPDTSTQGIAVLANTLEANEGTVRSSATQLDAGLSHAGLDYDPTHKVDWQRETPPPAKPSGLSLETEPGSLDVGVDWDDVEGAADYLVRWRLHGPGQHLNEGVRPTSSDTRITVAEYAKWVVRVEACNDAGCGPPVAQQVDITEAQPAQQSAGSAYRGQLGEVLVELSLRRPEKATGESNARSGSQQSEEPPPTTSIVYIVSDSGKLDSHSPELRSALRDVRDVDMPDTKVALVGLSFEDTQKTFFGLTDHSSAPWDDHISSFDGYQSHKDGSLHHPALQNARSLLDADDADFKKVILLSEAERDIIMSERIIDEIDALKNASIVVDTVSFGSFGLRDDDGASALVKRLANTTGGSYRMVDKPWMGTTNDPAAPESAMSEILKNLVPDDDSATLFLIDMSPSSFPEQYGFLERALKAAADRAEAGTGAQVGLAFFSTWDPAWPHTSDEDYRVLHAVGSSSLTIDISLFSVGGSDIDGALRDAHGTITDSTVTATNKRVVLISDGISGVDVQYSTLALYGSDTEEGVLLDTVAWRTHADRVAMKGWADEGNGSFSVAKSPPLAPRSRNSPATGAPAITGTVREGETLTADTSGISDADGLDNATFSYQWLADDADISGAAGNTYTLAAADEGNAVKVRVSFTDDAGHAETLTSAATAAVAGLPAQQSAGSAYRGQLGEVLVELSLRRPAPAVTVGGASARSQQSEEPPPTTSIVYVIDDSGSMDGDFPEVRTALRQVRGSTMANTKVALIAFGHDPKTVFGLTAHSTDATTGPWTEASIESFGGRRGGTRYEAPLENAKALLDADDADTKKIIFLTDAQANVIDNLVPPEAVQEIDDAGITVDTIGFGDHFSINFDGLELIATGTGGEHREVTKPSQGTTNAPAVTATSIADILEGTVADNTATLFLVDHSASLRRTWAVEWDKPHSHVDYTLINGALNAAATKAGDASGTGRQVGLATFLGETTHNVDTTYKSHPKYKVIHAIGSSSLSMPEPRHLRGAGSTDIDHALQQAYTTLSEATATSKRVVLITDGISAVDVQDSTLDSYKEEDAAVTLDVVAWSDHADRVQLKTWADSASGNFSVAKSPPLAPRSRDLSSIYGSTSFLLRWADPEDPAITKYQYREVQQDDPNTPEDEYGWTSWKDIPGTGANTNWYIFTG